MNPNGELTKEQLLSLATAMLFDLDGRWGVKIDDKFYYPAVILESIDDTRWTIRLHYNYDKRLEANASLDHLDPYLHRTPEEARPLIKMNPARSAHELGRDINRRVVSHLARLTAIADPRWVEDTQKKHNLRDRCQRLSDASGGRLTETSDSARDGSSYRREMSCPNAQRQALDVDAEIFADGVKLTLSDLPITLAEQVLALVGPHIGELNHERAEVE